MPEPAESPANLGQGKEQGNSGKPEAGHHRHIETIPHLDPHRGGRADHYREQRNKEQGRLRVKGVGQEAESKGSQAGLGLMPCVST